MFCFMALTRKRRKIMKSSLLAAAAVFSLQVGTPHISLAAEENYVSLARGEGLVFVTGWLAPQLVASPAEAEEIIFARQEKIFSALASAQAFLPLVGEPGVVADYWLTVTAYSSTPDQTDGSPYTTGWITPVRDGAVAANFLALGTRVRFPDYFGDKIFVVEDRMNVRYLYRADVWMPSRAQAKQFGLKYLRLEILAGRLPRDYVLANFQPAFPGRK